MSWWSLQGVFVRMKMLQFVRNINGCVESANLYGIKIGSVTWKYVQVPVWVEGYRYTNNRWTSLGALKVLSEQTIKDDPRKIYKNAMNDAINYYTSPKDMITQALFEYGIKHRSVFDHVTNW